MMAEAVIDTLVRMANCELIMPQSDGASRHIPQDMK
jgi:5-methylcytosine-specific restriction endonuclease McrA